MNSLEEKEREKNNFMYVEMEIFDTEIIRKRIELLSLKFKYLTEDFSENSLESSPLHSRLGLLEQMDKVYALVVSLYRIFYDTVLYDESLKYFSEYRYRTLQLLVELSCRLEQMSETELSKRSLRTSNSKNGEAISGKLIWQINDVLLNIWRREGREVCVCQ